MPAARSAQATGPPVVVGAGDIFDCLQSRDTQTDQNVMYIVAADPSAVVFAVGDNAYGDGCGSGSGDGTLEHSRRLLTLRGASLAA
jgi:hypothetical protein